MKTQLTVTALCKTFEKLSFHHALLILELVKQEDNFVALLRTIQDHCPRTYEHAVSKAMGTEPYKRVRTDLVMLACSEIMREHRVTYDIAHMGAVHIEVGPQFVYVLMSEPKIETLVYDRDDDMLKISTPRALISQIK